MSGECDGGGGGGLVEGRGWEGGRRLVGSPPPPHPLLLESHTPTLVSYQLCAINFCCGLEQFS